MKFSQIKHTQPAKAPSALTPEPKPLGQASRVSYYNARYGAALWAQLVAWQKNNYPRKSWSWRETSDTESTLKAKLYNSLKFLKDFGSPVQKELCEKLTFKKLDPEFVLTFKRIGLDTFSRSREKDEPTPSEQTRSARGGMAFDEIRRDVVRFVTEESYNAEKNTYPVYERLSVYLTPEQKEELEYITGQNPNCVAFFAAGTKGIVRLSMISDEEVARLGNFTRPPEPEGEATI